MLPATPPAWRVACAAQSKLRDKGVEVVEFDFLTPEAVADYCYDRGFLQVCSAYCEGLL